MKKKAWGITGLACGSLIALLAGIKYAEISSAAAYANAMPEYSETVETVKADVREYSKLIKVLGNTIIPNHIILQNEVSGVVAKVYRTSGAVVKTGDVIIQLNITAENAKINSAETREKLALSIYDRARQLREKDAISQEQFDQSYADLVVIKSEIEVLKDTIRKKTIKAPFDGVIGIHTAKIGSFMESNTQVVSISGDMGYVWIDFYVPQFYPKLALGNEVKISRVAQAESKDILAATISAIDDAVTVGMRSRKYRAQIESSLYGLDANTAVSVAVPVSEDIRVLVIPNIAVLSDLNGKYVYTLVSDELGKSLRAKRQYVQVLASDANNTMISEGITVNDIIAETGAFKLFEGVLVNTIEKKMASTSSNNSSKEG